MWRSLPVLSDALRGGEIDPAAAQLVAQTAASAPERERELVELAGRVTFSELRRRCEREVSSRQLEKDKVEREQETHQNRYLRLWRGRDGAGKGEFSLDPVSYARLVASIDQETSQQIEDAAKRKEEVRLWALQADALVALADRPRGEKGGARPTIVLRVDLGAFQRGETEPGETCELEGVGEVSVTAARAVLGDAFLKLVISRGSDPVSITHMGRHIRAYQETALWERDRGCVVCGTTRHVERDHWRVDYHDLGPTELDNLCLLCTSCHRMKTHRGWRLEGGPHRWKWIAPEEFDSPPKRREDTDAA